MVLSTTMAYNLSSFIYFHEGVHVESEKHGYSGGQHIKRVNFFPFLVIKPSIYSTLTLNISYITGSFRLCWMSTVHFIFGNLMKLRQTYTAETRKRWICDCVEWSPLLRRLVLLSFFFLCFELEATYFNGWVFHVFHFLK